MKQNLSLLLLAAATACAADQTVAGAGNALAEKIAAGSQLVQSAKESSLNNARQIQNANIRTTTLDAIANPSTCVAHRAGVDEAKKDAILQNLLNAGLINPADAASI